MPKILRLLVLSLALFIFSTFAVQAQEETQNETQHPLFDLFAAVPANYDAETNSGLMYIDYAALTSVYDEIQPYTEDEALVNAGADDRNARLWLAMLQRANIGPSWFTYIRAGGSARDVVGFDLVDAQRALLFGQPPSQAQVIQGDFSQEAIVSAFSANGYEQIDLDNGILIKRDDGKEGQYLDLTAINTANPFGGHLGRKEPVALFGDLLLNSPNDAMINTLIDTYQSDNSILADDNYIAIAEALTTDAALLQAWFFNTQAAFANITVSGFDIDITNSDNPLQPINASGVETYAQLPLYNLVAIADRQADETQIATVALVYDTREEAEAAAEEMGKRLLALQSNPDPSSPPLIEAVDGAELAETVIYESESTGKFVALVEIHTPQPPLPDEGEEQSIGRANGIIFRTWVQQFMQRTFYPIALDVPMSE